jgi:hypothetical protein
LPCSLPFPQLGFGWRPLKEKYSNYFKIYYLSNKPIKLTICSLMEVSTIILVLLVSSPWQILTMPNAMDKRIIKILPVIFKKSEVKIINLKTFIGLNR